ncbi:MAG TPA: 2-C-methyl-D-erythritol 2,4-cyclodiphosphate synthase, partial [Dehalococcoidales bacterium]|nr:2-C-methyl-D-erythritol 2,4-cyclodiphosphate synthase [Dehalococcoidales bacterium]
QGPGLKGISSLKLLVKVKQLLEENNWTIQNIDATVIAEKPRLREYIDKMRDELSKTLNLHINQVSIKASTSNGIGEIGKGVGIAALATCCLAENREKQGKIK